MVGLRDCVFRLLVILLTASYVGVPFESVLLYVYRFVIVLPNSGL